MNKSLVAPLPPVTEERCRFLLDEIKQDLHDQGDIVDGDFEVPFDQWQWVQLETGWLPCYVSNGSLMVAHVFFLEHGRVWTARNDPKELYIVGGAHPF